MSATNPLGFLGGMVLEIGAVIAIVAVLLPSGTPAPAGGSPPHRIPVADTVYHPIDLQPRLAPAVSDPRPALSDRFDSALGFRPAPATEQFQRAEHMPSGNAPGGELQMAATALHQNRFPRTAYSQPAPTYAPQPVEARPAIRELRPVYSSGPDLARPTLEVREYRPRAAEFRGHDYHDRY